MAALTIGSIILAMAVVPAAWTIMQTTTPASRARWGPTCSRINRRAEAQPLLGGFSMAWCKFLGSIPIATLPQTRAMQGRGVGTDPARMGLHRRHLAATHGWGRCGRVLRRRAHSAGKNLTDDPIRATLLPHRDGDGEFRVWLPMVAAEHGRAVCCQREGKIPKENLDEHGAQVDNEIGTDATGLVQTE